MSKTVLSVRIESSELEKFDAMARFCGQSRSEFFQQMIAEFSARTFDASRIELLASSEVSPPGHGGRTDDVPE